MTRAVARACAKSVHVSARATHGQSLDAHRNQDCPSWQGVQQRAWSLAALPQGLLCKGSTCRVANARRAGSRFCSFCISCFAATAFAKQDTRCEDFEQVLSPLSHKNAALQGAFFHGCVAQGVRCCRAAAQPVCPGRVCAAKAGRCPVRQGGWLACGPCRTGDTVTHASLGLNGYIVAFAAQPAALRAQGQRQHIHQRAQQDDGRA